MPLSEHEERILNAIEHELEHTGLFARTRAFLLTHQVAIGFALVAVAANVLLAMFAAPAVAAALSATLSAVAGYVIAESRHRARNRPR